MKRRKTREILIEVETIRIIKKRPAEKKTPPAKQKITLETLNCADAFAKSESRLEHLFDRLF